jgi:small-conductance mechanosensitive channel
VSRAAGPGQPGATAAVTAPPDIPAPGATGRPPRDGPEELKAENDELSAELASVRKQLAGEEKLREENSRLKRKLADAREQNAMLQQRVTELEAQQQQQQRRRPASQTPPRTGVQEMMAGFDGIPVIHHETGR